MIRATLFTGRESPPQFLDIQPETLRHVGTLDGWNLFYDTGRGLVLFVLELQFSEVRRLIVANDHAFCGFALPGKSGRLYSEIELRQAAAASIVQGD